MEGDTVRRKRAGVMYGENERPMRILVWDEGTRVLVFKAPAHQMSHRGDKDYFCATIHVCLVGEDPDSKGYLPAWELCQWDHDKGRYADPKGVK